MTTNKERMRVDQVTKESSRETRLTDRDHASRKSRNFGFKEIKIIEGNIGYLNLEYFDETRYAEETALAAMSFLMNAEALIIDLRENKGGSFTMMELLLSYLINNQEITQIHDLYKNATNKTAQVRRLPFIPGKEMEKIPLYILTGKQTSSTAAALSDYLQNRKRAIIIGEPSTGAARRMNENGITDPDITDDWRSTGIQPDVCIQAKQALLKTQQLIFEKFLEQEKENAYYNWQLIDLKTQLICFQEDMKLLKSYVGNYDQNMIFLEEGKLYFQSERIPKTQVHALQPDILFLSGNSNLRIKMIREKNIITGLMLLQPWEYSPLFKKKKVN